MTNNLWTLYAIDQLGESPWNNKAFYFKKTSFARSLNPTDHLDWLKSDEYAMLTPFVELIDMFGFEVFQKIHTDIRMGEPNPGEELRQIRDKGGEEYQWSQWMVRLANETGRDLAPFFIQHALPTQRSARLQLKIWDGAPWGHPVLPATTWPVPSFNISFVSASDTNGPRACDGDWNTAWNLDSDDFPASLTVDLGRIYQLTHVQVIQTYAALCAVSSIYDSIGAGGGQRGHVAGCAGGGAK